MSNSLFSLVSQSQDVTRALIESGGELTPEMETALATVEVKLPAKIDAYAAMLERLEMEEEYWRAKAKQFQAIGKGCSNVRDRLKEALKTAAEALGTDELVGVDMRFKISNSNPKLVIDQQGLSEDYLAQRVVFEPDNDKIREDLKAGVEIPGAAFVITKSLRIYANKGGAK